MEPRVEARFARIEALLHAMAERENQIEIRFNRRMDRADQRMDRADQRMDRAEKRLDRAEKRMERYDRRFERTSRLVTKMLVTLTDNVNELTRAQKALIDSLKQGRNGHGNGPGKR